MITNGYVNEQVARYSRQEREAAAAAGRLARAARSQRTAPPTANALPNAAEPGRVRIPRQRRWIDAVVASVR